MRKDGIDDEMYNDIKLDVMRYHVQFTLQITAEKLAEVGKTLGDLPIPSVEQIGNLAFAELIMHSQSPKNRETLNEIVSKEEDNLMNTLVGQSKKHGCHRDSKVELPNIILRYDESDRRDFSKIFREAIISSVSNVKTFTEKFA